MKPTVPSGLPCYEVHVADNFRYMDKEAEYVSGAFATADEALAKCRYLVEICLDECAEPGCTADQIFGCYRYFGDDPYIIARNGAPQIKFSGWDYAKLKSADFVT